MTNFVIFQCEPLKLTTTSYKIVEAEQFYLGKISHPFPFPSNNVDFSISNTAQMATPAQHCIEGGPWISGNCGQMHIK